MDGNFQNRSFIINLSIIIFIEVIITIFLSEYIMSTYAPRWMIGAGRVTESTIMNTILLIFTFWSFILLPFYGQNTQKIKKASLLLPKISYGLAIFGGLIVGSWGMVIALIALLLILISHLIIKLYWYLIEKGKGVYVILLNTAICFLLILFNNPWLIFNTNTW